MVHFVGDFFSPLRAYGSKEIRFVGSDSDGGSSGCEQSDSDSGSDSSGLGSRLGPLYCGPWFHGRGFLFPPRWHDARDQVRSAFGHALHQYLTDTCDDAKALFRLVATGMHTDLTGVEDKEYPFEEARHFWSDLYYASVRRKTASEFGSFMEALECNYEMGFPEDDCVPSGSVPPQLLWRAGQVVHEWEERRRTFRRDLSKAARGGTDRPEKERPNQEDEEPQTTSSAMSSNRDSLDAPGASGVYTLRVLNMGSDAISVVLQDSDFVLQGNIKVVPVPLLKDKISAKLRAAGLFPIAPPPCIICVYCGEDPSTLELVADADHVPVDSCCYYGIVSASEFVGNNTGNLLKAWAHGQTLPSAKQPGWCYYIRAGLADGTFPTTGLRQKQILGLILTVRSAGTKRKREELASVFSALLSDQDLLWRLLEGDRKGEKGTMLAAAEGPLFQGLLCCHSDCCRGFGLGPCSSRWVRESFVIALGRVVRAKMSLADSLFRRLYDVLHRLFRHVHIGYGHAECVGGYWCHVEDSSVELDSRVVVGLWFSFIHAAGGVEATRLQTFADLVDDVADEEDGTGEAIMWLIGHMFLGRVEEEKKMAERIASARYSGSSHEDEEGGGVHPEGALEEEEEEGDDDSDEMEEEDEEEESSFDEEEGSSEEEEEGSSDDVVSENSHKEDGVDGTDEGIADSCSSSKVGSASERGKKSYILRLRLDAESFAVMVTSEMKRDFRPLDSDAFLCRVRDEATGQIPRSDISHVEFTHGHKPDRARFAVQYLGLSKKDNFDISYSNGLRVQSPPGQFKWVVKVGNILWRENCARFGYPKTDKPARSGNEDAWDSGPSDEDEDGSAVNSGSGGHAKEASGRENAEDDDDDSDDLEEYDDE